MSISIGLRMWLLSTIALVIWSCEANDILFEDVSGAVVTLVDSTGPALASARTFVVPDTIIETDRSAGGIAHSSDRVITAAVRTHFLAQGWDDVADEPGVRPDVLVLVAAGTRVQTGVAYVDWYGGWGYLPYWSPAVTSAWVWGVPDGAVPYAFPAGTLFVTMLDLRDQREDTQSIPLLWAAVIDGILTGPGNTADRAIVGIDQAFAQSPYLFREP
jgi:hypothetical protein